MDKITILEIKEDRISDPSKRANVIKELTALRALALSALEQDLSRHEIVEELRRVNTLLWKVEDGIRDCERNKDFGNSFIELARSVYRYNDERARLKRALNELTGSDLIEEKSYSAP